MTKSVSPERTRRHGTIFARVVAGVVFIAGIIAMTFGALAVPPPADSSSPNQKQVTSTIAGEEHATETTTREGSTDPESPDGVTTKETVTTKPATEQTVETYTVTAPDTTLLGRAMANPASVLLLQFLVVLLASFLAALAAQRIYVGAYGIKLGSLEVAELGTVTAAEAASAQAAITTEDVPPATDPKPGLVATASEWWETDPEPGASDAATIAYQNVRLQLLVRQVAKAKFSLEVTPYDGLIGQLVKADAFTAEFGVGLLALRDLAVRVAAGAPFDASVGILMLASFRHAVRAMDQVATR